MIDVSESDDVNLRFERLSSDQGMQKGIILSFEQGKSTRSSEGSVRHEAGEVMNNALVIITVDFCLEGNRDS